MLSNWTSLKFCRLVKSKLFTIQFRLLMTLEKKPFENMVGKGENAGNQNVFYSISNTNHHLNYI